MKVVVAGVGAFGTSISKRSRRSTASRSSSLVGRQLAPTQEVAKKYGIAHATTQLGEALVAARRRTP